MNFTEVALSFSAVPLGLAAFNLVTWRRLVPFAGQTTDNATLSRRVSCLIPARNEEKGIREAVRSALASDSVLEVIVCDDGSSDATSALVLEEAQRDPRVHLIHGTELPKGWVGKPHACHQLGLKARGDYLLFLDADVRLQAGAVESLLDAWGPFAERCLITAVPEQKTETFFEKLVLPYLLLTYLCWLPLPLVERGRDVRTVAACGQVLGMSRSTYEFIGGFEAVRSAIVDDVAICRRAKSLGVRVCFRDGALIATCRMYEGLGQVWRGFSKNIFEGLSRSWSALTLAAVLYLTTFVLPFLVLPFACGRTALLAAASVVANWGLRFVMVARYRQSWTGAVLHPFGALLVVAIALNSARWSLSGKIEWAGRSYPERRS